MMIFETENKRKVVTVNKSLAKYEAIIEANKHFKVRKTALSIRDAWVKGDYLYFEEIKGGRNVWAIWKTL